MLALGEESIYVMSNHFHLVVHMSPATSVGWSAEDVARPWVKLYPTGKSETNELNSIANPNQPKLPPGRALTSPGTLVRLRALEAQTTKQTMLKHALLILQNRQRVSVGRAHACSDDMES